MDVEVGSIVEGKVSGITNFGVFVDIFVGVEFSSYYFLKYESRSFVAAMKELISTLLILNSISASCASISGFL